MKKDKLTDYILHLKNWISKDITKQTLKEISEKEWSPHYHINNVTLKPIIKENELTCLESDDSLTYQKKLHDLLWKALETYI